MEATNKLSEKPLAEFNCVIQTTSVSFSQKSDILAYIFTDWCYRVPTSCYPEAQRWQFFLPHFIPPSNFLHPPHLTRTLYQSLIILGVGCGCETSDGRVEAAQHGVMYEMWAVPVTMIYRSVFQSSLTFFPPLILIAAAPEYMPDLFLPQEPCALYSAALASLCLC